MFSCPLYLRSGSREEDSHPEIQDPHGPFSPLYIYSSSLNSTFATALIIRDVNFTSGTDDPGAGRYVWKSGI